MFKFAKWMRVALITVLCLSLSLLFVACNPDDDKGGGDNGGSGGTGGNTTQKYSAFFYNQTTLVASVETEFNKTVSEPSSPSKTGYVFDGWFEDNQTFTVSFDSSKSYNKDVSFYAKWKAAQYTVTFDTNGGTSDVQSANVTFDELITLPTPTRTGYAFDGWYDADNNKYVSGIWNTSKNITLVAKWVANTYTIVFDANGGMVAEQELVVTYDENFALINLAL